MSPAGDPCRWFVSFPVSVPVMNEPSPAIFFQAANVHVHMLTNDLRIPHAYISKYTP